MYYRRKILLSLLEVFENELEKIHFQKLLLLLNKFQEKPSYDFVPYKYGCFSFQANADLNTMIKYQQIESSETSWKRIEKESYIKSLKKNDKQALSDLKRAFGKKTKSDLIKLTYKRYPYFALNSIIAKQILTTEELQKVERLKQKSRETCLFTIGYEGITLEAYLNKLIRRGVNALVDVRKNSFSMKYGFSKKQLTNACHGVNIHYYHFPELGIVSEKRKELNSQKDYDILFEQYKESALKNTIDTQKKVLELLIKHNRIALTCFEANICQCHRKPLAEAIKNLPDFRYKLKHI